MSGTRSRRLRVLILGTVCALGFLTAGAGPASAHATVVVTSPVPGSELSDPPTEVSLVFSEAVGFNARSVEVLDAEGNRVDNRDVDHVAGDPRTVGVTLPRTLARASYLVVWHVVSADSHPVGGTFTFGFGVPAGQPTAPAAVDGLVGRWHAIVRFGALAGALLLVGATFFLIVVWRDGARRKPVHRLLVSAWVVCGVSTAALFVLEGPYGAALSFTDLLDPTLLAVTFSTIYGKLLLLRLAALLAAAPLWRGITRRAQPPGRLDAFGLGLLVVESFSFAGHAGQGDLTPLATTVDALHVTAAGIWLGGLAVLTVALRGGRDPGPAPSLVAALPRWSRVAMVSVATLAATGAYQAWREVGSVDAALETGYGRLVLGKTAGLIAMLALANAGRLWVRRQVAGPADDTGIPGVRAPARALVMSGPPADPPSPAPPGEVTGPATPPVRNLRRSVVAELAIGIAVVGLTAALVNAVPARQDYVPDVDRTVTAVDVAGDRVQLHLVVRPARAARETVTLQVTTPAGAAMPFQAASGSLSNPELGLGPIAFDLGGGVAGATGPATVGVPAPGLWHLVLQVRVDAFTDYSVETTYPVR